jgi:hypothetical protein
MAEVFTGRIYRILSDSHPEVLPYYGSTKRKLYDRWNTHKSIHNRTVSKKLMIYDDVRIELVEEFVCDSKITLLQREKWYINNNPCCNDRFPIQTEEERKLYILEYNKANLQKRAEQKRNLRKKI